MPEDIESFDLNISSLPNGVILGNFDQARIIIVDDDGK